MKHTILLVAAIAGIAPCAAHAGTENLAVRAATSAGLYIAAQGNAALSEIREEFRKDLVQRLRPYLPQPDDERAPVTAPDHTLRATHPES